MQKKTADEDHRLLCRYLPFFHPTIRYGQLEHRERHRGNGPAALLEEASTRDEKGVLFRRERR